MFNDLKFALRSLLKTPGFFVIAVVILALGIGANTAIFSAFNAVLLRSLPVPDPQNLRSISWLTNDATNFGLWVTAKRQDSSGTNYDAFNYTTYELFRDKAVGFDSIFSYAGIDGATIRSGRSAPKAVEGLFVSGNFFEGYGGRALLGRLLNVQDDRPGSAIVAVISYQLWSENFALDPQIVGRSVTINNISVEVVGVLQRAYRGPLAGDPTRFYVPNALNAVLARSSLMAVPALTEPSFWSIQVMGRRNPQISEREAQASLDVLFKQSLQALGKTPGPGKHWRIVLEDGQHGPMSTATVQQAIARPMYVLAAAAAVLLLLTCANLAGLMLARAAVRQREVAIRAAMGASGWRILRQPLIEAVMLAVAGGLLGLLLAASLAHAGDSIIPRLLPAGQLSTSARLMIGLDRPVLLFAFLVTLLTALICGIFPALQASRTDPLATIRKSPTGLGRQGVAKGLISIQVALSLLLLIGAGLLTRTLMNLSSISPGFDPESVLLFEVAPSKPDIAEEGKIRFFDEVTRSVATIPGVQTTSLSNWPLMSGYQLVVGILVHASDSSRAPVATNFLSVGDSFLSTMRIALLSGRDFNSKDTATSERVAIVNEEFARRHLKGRNPLDTLFEAAGKTYRIVGLARDSRFVGAREPISPLIYFSFRQSMMAPRMVVAVRSELPAAVLAPAIQKVVRSVDADVPILNVRTQRELINSRNSTEMLLASFSSFVAILSALLSGFGLFGLLAYSVARRTSEIGIRSALGAQRTDVVKAVVGQGVRTVLAGLVLGGIAAYWAAQLLSRFLYGVNPIDPLTIVAAILALVVVATVASYLPARRATKIDPLVALRAE